MTNEKRNDKQASLQNNKQASLRNDKQIDLVGEEDWLGYAEAAEAGIAQNVVANDSAWVDGVDDLGPRGDDGSVRVAASDAEEYEVAGLHVGFYNLDRARRTDTFEVDLFGAMQVELLHIRRHDGELHPQDALVDVAGEERAIGSRALDASVIMVGCAQPRLCFGDDRRALFRCHSEPQ